MALLQRILHIFAPPRSAPAAAAPVRDADADRAPPPDFERELTATLAPVAAGCGLILIRNTGDIAWFNQPSHDWFGLSDSRDIGRNITHLIRDHGFLDCLRRGDYGRIITLKRAVSGISLGLYILPCGRSHQLIVAHDFSHLHRLEDSSREIISNLSHELRSPLTVIKGYLDVLAKVYSQDGQGGQGDIQQAIDNMLGQCNRMQQMVENVLLLGRLETHVLDESELEVTDIARLVAGLVEDMRRIYPGRRIETDICTHRMRCVPAEMYSVFSNLLSNALNYSDDDSVVELRWRPCAEGACFDVIDQGVGIEPRHIPHLTERFYRVDKTRSGATGGTGLGLAIVDQTLRRYDAELKVSSEVGKGSVFSCVFPAKNIYQPPP